VRHHDTEGRAAALSACPDPDILVTNGGGPPPGDFAQFDRRRVDSRDRRQHADADRAHEGDGRQDGSSASSAGIVNITSSACEGAIDILGLSNGARKRA
jgi:3-oxoacyl-[acyl-carrier protein] reductase